MKFKSAVLLVFFVSCAVADDTLPSDLVDYMTELHKTCVTKTGIAEDAVTNAQKGEFSDDRDLKCYMHCIMSESGLMNEEGKLDASAVPHLTDDLLVALNKVVEVCLDKIEGETDLCERAFLYNQCHQKVDSKTYYLP